MSRKKYQVNKEEEIPFYKLPINYRGSAEIIRQAKEEVMHVFGKKRPNTSIGRGTFRKTDAFNDFRPSTSPAGQSRSESRPPSRPLSAIRLKPLRATSAFVSGSAEALQLQPTVTKIPLVDRAMDNQTFYHSKSHSSLPGLSYNPPPKGNGIGDYLECTKIIFENKEEWRQGKKLISAGEPYLPTEFDLAASSSSDEDDAERRPILESFEDEQHSSNESLVSVSTKFEKFISTVDDFFPEIEKHFPKGKLGDEYKAIVMMEKLSELFLENKKFSRQFPTDSRLIKFLFGQLNMKFQTLSIHVCKILLQVELRGDKLTKVLKHLFIVCQTEGNVLEFLESGTIALFVKSMEDISMSNNVEGWKYGMSLLCLLAEKHLLWEILRILDCPHILLLHLTALNDAKDCNYDEDHYFIATKTVAAMKCLAENEMGNQFLLANNAPEQLVQCLSNYKLDATLVLMLAELLSNFTESSECCSSLFECKDVHKIFGDLVFYHKQQLIISHHAMLIIGNLILHCPKFAVGFYSLSKLTNGLVSYLDLFIKQQIEKLRMGDTFSQSKFHGSGDDNRNFDMDDVDLVVKDVRIFANMCLCSDVGRLLAKNEKIIVTMLRILSIQNPETIQDDSEPLMCALAVLANLSYFTQPQSEIKHVYIRMTDSMVPLLSALNSMEVRINVCNVIQNLTRLPEVRAFIIERRLILVFLSLFEESEQEVAICGYEIMMNLLLEKSVREPFYQAQGVTKLLHKLHMCLSRDWKTATLLCQMLWNYCSLETKQKPLTDMEIRHLLKVLSYCSGEKGYLECDDETTEIWRKQFCPIAKKLIDLLETFSKET